MQKTALITGSSRGIGAATARLLAQQGYDLCINYHKDQLAAELLAEELRDGKNTIITVQADVSQEDDILRLFETVDQKLGMLSALVNNAALMLPQSRVEDLSMARVTRMLNTNVASTFICCREAVKRMSHKHGGQGGSIVNVSSVAARLGSAGEYVDYAASKGAIDTLTTGLSAEVAGEGIRVSAVRPGFIYTNMHADGGEPNRVDRIKSGLPMQRGGQPEEVAQAIAWLLSDAASYTTGSFIEVSGGR